MTTRFDRNLQTQIAGATYQLYEQTLNTKALSGIFIYQFFISVLALVLRNSITQTLTTKTVSGIDFFI